MIELLESRFCLSAPHPVVPPRPKPQAPFGLTVTEHSNATAVLDWADDVKTPGVFTVERLKGGKRFTVLARTKIESYTDSTVAPNNTYSYRIVAANGTLSNTAGLGILNISLVASEDDVQLSWQALAGGQTYNVYRGLANPGENNPAFLIRVGTTTGTSFTDNPPDDGQTYEYLIESTANDAGNSMPVTVWPIPVQNFQSSYFLGPDNHYNVQLSWTPESQYVATYEIQRSADNGATWITVADVPAPAESFVDVDVPDGTTLMFRIAEVPAAN